MFKIVIVGPGSAGKDFFASKLIEKGAVKSISYTTRPKRKNETDGIDYHFISKEDFEKKIEEDYWYEWDLFRPELGWYYGQSKEDIKNSDLFIKTVEGVRKIKPEDRKNITVIYLDIPEEIRRERLNKRKDKDDPERRLESDRKDFENFTDYDIIIKNNDF